MGNAMRKVNLILIMVLSLTLIGVATYTVYATIQYSVTLTNKIRFNSEGVYFTANIKVYNADNMAAPIINSNYNKQGTPEDDTGDFAFPKASDFEKDTATSFVYVIKISNYSEFNIKASIQLSSQASDVSDYVINEINKNNITIEKFDSEATFPESDELKLTTRCINFMQSFQFNNGFIINLTQI